MPEPVIRFSHRDQATSPAPLTLGYLLINISFALILPVLSTVAEHYIDEAMYSWHLAAKWLIFWGAGVRLFTTGLRQAANPEYTAINIFKLKGEESYVVIRELGFANIALGIMGILSVLNDSWRLLAAIAAAIFFGFAAMQHCSRSSCSANEKIALAYDVALFIGLFVYIILLHHFL